MLYKHIYEYRRNTASESHAFSASLDKEEIFYGALYGAIPEEIRPNYMRQITFLKINGLFPIAYSHPEILASRPAYVRQLLNEARECGYRMTPAEWLVTHTTQRQLLKLTGLAELARRSLSYRIKAKLAKG